MPEFNGLLRIVDAHKKKIAAVEARARKAAIHSFQSTMAGVTEYTALVARNNPGKSIDEILARPDISIVYQAEIYKSQKAAQKIIQKAFADGAKVGRAQVRTELKYLGIPVPSIPALEETPYVGKLLDDLNRNFDFLAMKAQDAFREAWAEIPDVPFEKGKNVAVETANARSQRAIATAKQTAATLAYRAGLGASVASHRGFTEQQIEAYAELQSRHAGWVIKKVWTANFVANKPCPTCAALHGTEISIESMFLPRQSFKNAPRVYQDLAGPPRHPNCRCRLTISIEQQPLSPVVGRDGWAMPEAQEQQSVSRNDWMTPLIDDHHEEWVPMIAQLKRGPAAMRNFSQSQSDNFDGFDGISSQSLADSSDSEKDTLISKVITQLVTIKDTAQEKALAAKDTLKEKASVLEEQLAEYAEFGMINVTGNYPKALDLVFDVADEANFWVTGINPLHPEYGFDVYGEVIPVRDVLEQEEDIYVNSLR